MANPVIPEEDEKVAHIHTHPSPSLAPAAWCNGSTDDHGCGQLVPLWEFSKDRRDVDAGFVPYLVDGRWAKDGKFGLLEHPQVLVVKVLELLAASADISRTGDATPSEWARFHKATHAVWLEMGRPLCLNLPHPLSQKRTKR